MHTPPSPRPRAAALGRALAYAAIPFMLLSGTQPRAENVHAGTPENYRQLLAVLRAGDTLTLAPGEYRDGLPLHGMSGEPGRPITVSGPEHGSPATFIARSGRNTVTLRASRHLVVRNMVLDGRDLPVDAVKAERGSACAHDITLENLHIRRHGHDQQTVGISTKCAAWNWTIRGNTIVGAGTGLYLGDSDGSAAFVAGLIERNVIVDTLGYNIQVKHQLSRPDGGDLREGPATTVIRHNVLSKAQGGAAGSARPNLLLGHFPPHGRGSGDRYLVYGNFFHENPHEALLQGEGNIAVYSNLFINSHGDAIRIQPHNDIPRIIDIAFNTIVAARAGVSIVQKEGAAPYRHAVTGNAVFAGVALTGGEHAHNFTAPFAQAGRFLERPFAAPGFIDLHPKDAMPRVPALPLDFPDADRDFDGLPREWSAAGAYAAGTDGARWLPALERKPE
jgi:hypothetical protein